MADGSRGAGAGGTGGALVICTLGVALILVQSIYDIVFSSPPAATLGGTLSISAAVVGVVGLVGAVLMEVLGIAIYFAPERHRVLGVGIMTLSLLSFYSGGGYLLGGFLCYVASLIAIFASIRTAARPARFSLPAEAAEDPVLEADLLAAGGRRSDDK